jgi:hypothetical protein
MLNFLLWCLIVFLALNLFWRFFGVYILRWAVFRFLRKIEQDQMRMRNNMGTSTDPNYEREVHLDDERKVKVPRKETRPNKSAFAEDVEFEDLPR